MTDSDKAKQFRTRWIDGEREPREPPNPDFPDGIYLNERETRKNCVATLPYPARRCGFYIVGCRLCGSVVACTTAGRADDPRSIRMPCNLETTPGRGPDPQLFSH